MEEMKKESVFMKDSKKNDVVSLLNDNVDKSSARVSIYAGAGGPEAFLWVQMLLHMLTKWGESKKFTITQFEKVEDEEMGIQSVTIQIMGDYAYGLLKSEEGVHRLIRIPPHNTDNRRHLSFASIYVSPCLGEQIESFRKEKQTLAQIRNYTLDPYRQIKDLRTNVETEDTNKVLSGDLDIFILGYLKSL